MKRHSNREGSSVHCRDNVLKQVKAQHEGGCAEKKEVVANTERWTRQVEALNKLMSGSDRRDGEDGREAGRGVLKITSLKNNKQTEE